MKTIKMYIRSGGGISTKGVKKGKGARSGKGVKKGALVAIKNDKDEIVIGHSRWHRKKDKYNPKHGMQIAIERAETDSKAAIATSLIPHLAAFIDRSKKYFKTKVFSENTMALVKVSDARVLKHKIEASDARVLQHKKVAAATEA